MPQSPKNPSQVSSATTPTAKASQTTLMQDALHLVLATLSIYTCYIVYGVMQEKIYKGSYKLGDTDEHFSYALFLVFVQSLANLAFGFIRKSSTATAQP